MKNQILSLVVLTAIATSVAAGEISADSIQPDFAKILLQPEDQLVPIGSNAVFVVIATNGPLAYQWFRNGIALTGQTNETLVITNAQVSDVGLYSCGVFRGIEVVPTRAASLMVFTSSIDPADRRGPGYRVRHSPARRRFTRRLSRTLCGLRQLHQTGSTRLGLGAGHQQWQHPLHRQRHQPDGYKNSIFRGLWRWRLQPNLCHRPVSAIQPGLSLYTLFHQQCPDECLRHHPGRIQTLTTWMRDGH